MAKRLQLRGGTTAQHSTFTGALREVTVDTDKDTLVVHDGATAGGFPLAKYSDVTAISTDLVNDTTPQLGGNLDLNSSDITGTGNVNITGTVTATSFSGDGSGLSGVTSVGGATGVDFNDNVKARFGTDNDLQIYHDGSNSYIKETGTGDLIVQGVNVRIQGATTGNNMFVGIDNGASTLYYQNNAKLATTTNGVTITGGVNDSLRVTNDTDTSTNAPDIVLYRNSVSPADDDNLGFIEFTGNQSNGNEHTYAYINAKAKDVTAGTEDAEIEFAVSKAGTATIISSVTNSGFVPYANDTYDLGSSSLVWRNIYTGDLHLSNEAKSEGNSIDGTKGNWTIQEGSEDLFIVNNKSGKKYKFKLEEI